MQFDDSPSGETTRPAADRRRHLYQLAAIYDRCVIDVWITKHVRGREAEHSTALEQLETARRRLDRAGRGHA